MLICSVVCFNYIALRAREHLTGNREQEVVKGFQDLEMS